jgi:tRNA A37 threonylcarbamoyladenosine modification protein TsaB
MPVAHRSTGTSDAPGRLQDVLVLALDTATPASTAAVAEVTGAGMRGLAERREVDTRAHGELLAPAIAETLAEAGLRSAG